MLKIIRVTIYEKDGEDLTDSECDEICDYIIDRVDEMREEIPHSNRVSIEY